MRKTGWAAAAGLGPLVLLLTACGGSSGSSASSPGSTPTATAQAQASSSALAGIGPGSIVLIVQKSAIGYVLAEANGQVVYTYGKDTKGGSPMCTGSCASTWPAVTGKPVASLADKLPGTLSTVSNTSHAKQVTYDGLPLYTYKGARAFVTTGNGVDGMWHVIKLAAGDISS